MLDMLDGFPVSPSAPDSAITGGLTSQSASRGLAPPPQLARGIEAAARGGELRASGEKAFVATLGFLAGNLKRLGWSKERLVAVVKERFGAVGVPAPAIDARALGKMNLKGVAGLESAKPPPRPQGGGGGGGRGGGRRF